MKKGLSVLLIVAALFGFYGGASSLTDVLACKDYWEKEGEKSTADMNKLEDGLNQLGDNEEAYLDGVKQVADGEVTLEEGKQTLAEKEAEFAAAPAKLRKGEADLAAGKAAYKAGKAQYEAGKKALADGKAAYKDLTGQLALLKDGFDTWQKGMKEADGSVKAVGEAAHAPAYAAGISGIQDNGTVTSDKIDAFVPVAKAVAAGKFRKELGAIEVETPQGKTAALVLIEGTYGLGHEITGTTIDKDINTLISRANSPNPQNPVDGLLSQSKAKLNSVKEGLDSIGDLYKLPAGRKEMTNKITALLTKLSKDEDNLKKIGGKEGLEKIKRGLAGTDAEFDYTVTELIKIADKMVKEAAATIAQGEKDLKSAEKELAAGAKKIKAGEAKLAQGYADYKAAPAKLAAGRQQLADGLKQLEEGKKQLAQYEDGEQQVRDGLATLMSTEPNGGLESILDRRGGDDEFDDANGHLDIQEGLDAVDVGRGYQADSGELITKEITNRAVGTAAGLGAAVLACLAALLSLIKKYKGAAVTAVLAAIAGVAGAVVGNGAGSEFSNIAGSTVGSLPWIAAGVVAAVACVFAIVNFTAKAE